MSDVLVVRVASMVGPQGPAGPPGSGTILPGDGILVESIGADVQVSADLGTGTLKVQEATKTAIESSLALGSGVLKAASGVIGSATKGDLEGVLAAGTGLVRATSDALEGVATILTTDLAAGGTDGQMPAKSGTGFVWTSAASGGDTVTQGTGILITGSSPKTVAADFGSGAGKVQTATKAALETTFSLASGLLKAASGVFGLAAKTDVEAVLAIGTGLVKSTANALGLATKADVEALLAQGTGIVKSTSNTLSAVSTLLPTDLAASGTTLQKIRINAAGTAMEWFTTTDMDGAGVVTGLSSASVIPVTTALSFGTLLPTTGFLRYAHNSTSIVGRNSTNASDFNLMIWGSSANRLDLGNSVGGFAGVVLFGGGSTSIFGPSSVAYTVTTLKFTLTSSGITLGTTTANTNDLVWSAQSLAPNVTQTTAATDVATKTFTFNPQAPFATATGTNRVPGGFKVNIGTPTASGTTHGAFTVDVAGANILTIDKDTSGNGRVRMNVSTTASAPAAAALWAIININGTDYKVALSV
jgi:hypothetical protein